MTNNNQSEFNFDIEKYYCDRGTACIICGAEGSALCGKKCLKTFNELYRHEAIPYKRKPSSSQKKLGKYLKQLNKVFGDAIYGYTSQEMDARNFDDNDALNKQRGNALSNILLPRQESGDMNTKGFHENPCVSLIAQSGFDKEQFGNSTFDILVNYLGQSHVVADYLYGHDARKWDDDTDNFGKRLEATSQYLKSIYPQTYKKEFVNSVLTNKKKVTAVEVVANMVWFLFEAEINNSRTKNIYLLLSSSIITCMTSDSIFDSEFLAGAIHFSGFKNSMDRPNIIEGKFNTSPFPYDVLIGASIRSEVEHDALSKVTTLKDEIQAKLQKCEKNETFLKRGNQTLKKKLAEIKELENLVDKATSLRDKNRELQNLLQAAKTEILSLKKEIPQIEILKEENATLKEQIVSLSTSDHPSQNIIETLPVMFPKCAKDLLINAKAIFSDRLVITSQAIESALSVEIDQNTIQKGWNALDALANFLWVRRYEKDLITDEALFKSETGLTLSMSESPGVKNNHRLMEQRAILHNDKKYFANSHIKIGTKSPQLLRIHFVFLENENKLLIAHFGDHLETSSTRKK